MVTFMRLLWFIGCDERTTLDDPYRLRSGRSCHVPGCACENPPIVKAPQEQQPCTAAIAYSHDQVRLLTTICCGSRIVCLYMVNEPLNSHELMSLKLSEAQRAR